ncbi:hypothetical protein [Synechococcus sp. UW179A]|uniref:hypothetical protein n=1 Tax=Synechococcus sp. UW179A TaxID=2575510 RepID=UPI000E0EA9E7|nr:hypothetical protein [Synechococcus sp. UW179A]
MAIQPSDLGEEFIKSGKRLITQRSSDELLGRAITLPAEQTKSEEQQRSKHAMRLSTTDSCQRISI